MAEVRAASCSIPTAGGFMGAVTSAAAPTVRRPGAIRRKAMVISGKREPRRWRGQSNLCARRSDDTEARHSRGEKATARERPQAGSCRPAMMDVINLAGELRHSIETGEPDPCQLGSPAGRDKRRNAFRKALRKETGRSTTGLVALRSRSKLALISRSVSRGRPPTRPRLSVGLRS